MINLKDFLEDDLLQKFEFQNYGHALEILFQSCTEEWDDIKTSLCNLKIYIDDINEAEENKDTKEI